jgi:hypothetical protein
VPRITSREVERDGDVTIEILAGDQVWIELTWNGALPLVAPQIGWTLVPRHDLPGAREEPWPWDADEQRDLAQLADALHDHRHRRAVRSEVRVRYWEFRARETSAEAAAAWGRDWLARTIGGRPGPGT